MNSAHNLNLILYARQGQMILFVVFFTGKLLLRLTLFVQFGINIVSIYDF